MTDTHQPQLGDRRKSPDGGGQIYANGVWYDLHSPKGRAIAASMAATPEPEKLPHNVEAEQAFLGALMRNGNDALATDASLKAEHFYEPFHGRLYDGVLDQLRKGRATDPALLSSRFGDDPAWQDVGGIQYLWNLADRAPPAQNAGDYAREIVTAHTRRELMRLGVEVVQLGAEGCGLDGVELAAQAERIVAQASAGVSSGAKLLKAGGVVRQAIQRAKERDGTIEFPTGIQALDDVLGGLHAKEVTLLAARPGMGKTVGGLTIAKANAERGLGTCVFSLEMGDDALGLRLATDVVFDRFAPRYLGRTTNITFDRAMKGQLDPGEWSRLEAAQAVVDDWPLYFDTRDSLTLDQIESAVRRAHLRWRQQGIKLGPVIIDHLGKVRPTINRRGDKRVEVADVSNETSNMAKRLGVPVVALVQLSRGVESRDDKRPVLSDLRQAGELEEDARQVCFLYRPEYYLRDPVAGEDMLKQTEREAELRKVENHLYWLVEKNSHGPKAQVHTFCEIACSAIRDWEGRP